MLLRVKPNQENTSNKWKQFQSKIDQVPLEFWMVISLIGIIFNLCLQVDTLSILGLSSLFLATGKAFLQSSQICRGKKWAQMLNKYGIIPVVFVITLVILWLDSSLTPAHALFFDGGEKWIRDTFNPAPKDADITRALDLIVGAIRGIFILYISFKGVQTLNANQKDEDWKEIAKEPIQVTTVVVVTNALVNLVI